MDPVVDDAAQRMSRVAGRARDGASHLPDLSLQLGVVLDELTDAQAEYLGIPKAGPFKSEMYRY